MGSRFWSVGLAVLLVLLCAGAGADTLSLPDGRQFPGVSVEAWNMTPDGGSFTVHPDENGAPSDSAYPVASSGISTLIFHGLNHPAEPATGRRARMGMADGTTYEDVAIERATYSSGVLTFRVRQAGVAPGGAAFEVTGSRVASLAFYPIWDADTVGWGTAAAPQTGVVIEGGSDGSSNWSSQGEEPGDGVALAPISAPVAQGPVSGLANAIYWIANIISFGAGIWMIVIAFKKGVAWGIGMFVPCVNIVVYFAVLFSEWQDAKWPFLIGLGCLGLMVVAYLIDPRVIMGL